MSAHPFAIKINAEEAAEFLGHPLNGDQAICSAAYELQAQGANLVVLTRGARGLVVVLRGELALAMPPPVTVRSPIGAGDATLAGLLWAVLERCDPAATARRAVACGTATAMQEGTLVGDRALIEELLNQVQVTRS
jgi:fructose-1-phosphate kinase PfkB-like protein